MNNFTIYVRGVVIQCDTIDDLRAVLLAVIDRYGTVDPELAKAFHKGQASIPNAESTLHAFHGIGGDSKPPESKPDHSSRLVGREFRDVEIGKLAERIVYTVVANLGGLDWWNGLSPKGRAEIATGWIESVEHHLKHARLNVDHKAIAAIKRMRLDAEDSNRDEQTGIGMLRNWLRRLHMDLTPGWDQDTSQDAIAELLGEYQRAHERAFKVKP